MIGAECEHCGRVFERKSVSHLSQPHTYCSQKCAGAAKSKRYWKPKAQRIADKAAYDREYRRKNLATIKAKKRAFYLATFDPEKMRRERKKRAKWHVEYCRRYYSDPRRKAQKVAYDADRRASSYGEYADAFKVLLVLKKQLLVQCPDKYERLKARGYYEMQNQKRRERRHAQK